MFKKIFIVSLSLFALMFCAAIYSISNQMVKPRWYQQLTPPALIQFEPGGAMDETWMGISSNPKEGYGINYQDVSFKTENDSTLKGWFAPHPDNTERIIICAHGGGTDRRGFLRHLPVFHNAGYPVLLFDYREHGASDGTGQGISFGKREHADILAAVDYAKNSLGFKHIAVVGTSMGAASALIAASKTTDIEVVIAINPYTSLLNLVSDTEHQGNKAPAAIIKPSVALTRFRLGATNQVTPIEAVVQAKQPTLFIHGTADKQVPYQHSIDLHAAKVGPKDLWIAPDARHVHIYHKYPEEFSKRTSAFLTKYFTGQ